MIDCFSVFTSIIQHLPEAVLNGCSERLVAAAACIRRSQEFGKQEVSSTKNSWRQMVNQITVSIAM